MRRRGHDEVHTELLNERVNVHSINRIQAQLQKKQIYGLRMYIAIEEYVK